MVIECPSCHTKFYVDGSQLEEVENPQFHCSRCDHLFELEEENSTDSETSEEQPSQSSAPEEAEPEDKEAPDAEGEQLDLLPKRPNYKYRETIRVDRTELDYKVVNGKIVPLITADWPDLDDAGQHEADLRSPPARETDQDYEEDPGTPPTQKQNQSITGVSASESSPDQMRSSEALWGDDSAAQEDDSFTKRADSSSMLETFANPSEKDSQSASMSLSASLLILFSLPLLLCLCLFAWSQNINRTPLFMKDFLYFGHSEFARPAPPGLELLDLESKLITLDDGNQVIEISGNLFNSRKESFTDITIEAKLYDKENKELTKVRTSANNGLQGAQINTFRPEFLNALQQQTAAGVFRLDQDQKSTVKVVFTNSIADASWFSARIYSTHLAGT